jgi:hypothetical protein
MTTQIAVIRASNALADADVISMLAAVQITLSRDFAPHWSDATLIFVPPGQTETLPPGSMQIWIKDHTDQAGSAGYHTDDGFPISYVFWQDDLDNGMLPSVTFTHELWEMLADPDINKTVTVGNIERPIECADCCEDDSLAYSVTGPDGRAWPISAFALPSWFDPNGAAPFTFPVIAGIGAPFALAPGGYIGERVLPDGAWTMRFAEGEPGVRTVKAEGSRTMRRFRGEV